MIQVLAQQIACEPDSLTPEMTLRELEVDSLALIETIVILEAEFGIDLPPELDGVNLDTTLSQAAEAIRCMAAQDSESTQGPLGVDKVTTQQVAAS
nr:acyl carrier protein [Streptomyces sp. SID14478]